MNFAVCLPRSRSLLAGDSNAPLMVHALDRLQAGSYIRIV